MVIVRCVLDNLYVILNSVVQYIHTPPQILSDRCISSVYSVCPSIRTYVLRVRTDIANRSHLYMYHSRMYCAPSQILPLSHHTPQPARPLSHRLGDHTNVLTISIMRPCSASQSRASAHHLDLAEVGVLRRGPRRPRVDTGHDRPSPRASPKARHSAQQQQ